MPPLMERYVGLLFVLALHAAVLWGLWQHRMIPAPNEAVTLFVNFIAPPAPEPPVAPKPPPPKPSPRPVEKPAPRQIVAEVQAPADPADYVAPPPPPVIAAPAPPPPAAPPAPAKPAEPLRLGGELSAVCPERTPPRYPLLSRRMGEEGVVVLRVEIDTQGGIGAVRVANSSGFPRLDEAALAAVRTWRCTPALRDGQPVRAVAVQPFNFILQGN